MSTEIQDRPKITKPLDPEALAHVNRELRARLVRASELIKGKNAEIIQLRAFRDANENNASVEQTKETLTEGDMLDQDDSNLEFKAKLYGFEGSEEHMHLTDRITELEDQLRASEAAVAKTDRQLEQRDRDFQMKVNETTQIIIDLRQEVREKDKEVENLKSAIKRSVSSASDEGLRHQLTVSTLHIAGLEAQVSAFRNAHEESHLLKSSAGTSDGKAPKSRLRVIYEDAFDQKGVDYGFSNPQRLRNWSDTGVE